MTNPPSSRKPVNISKPIEESFQLIGGNFGNAGEVPIKLKQKLAEIGLDDDTISRAGIAAFEAEMNVIIHAAAGWLRYYITPERLRIVVEDMGPGIENIDLAMKEGYTTAPEWVKEMGWGAGMGLPNIKKNADKFHIDTIIGEGTTLEIIINFEQGKRNEG